MKNAVWAYSLQSRLFTVVLKRLKDFFTGNNYLFQEELENKCGWASPKQQIYIYIFLILHFEDNISNKVHYKLSVKSSSAIKHKF